MLIHHPVHTICTSHSSTLPTTQLVSSGWGGSCTETSLPCQWHRDRQRLGKRPWRNLVIHCWFQHIRRWRSTWCGSFYKEMPQAAKRNLRRNPHQWRPRRTFEQGLSVQVQQAVPGIDIVESEACPYSNMAGQVAKNVSDAVMHWMNCTEGTWQTLTHDCPRKAKKSRTALLMVDTSSTMYWYLLVVLALVFI